MGVASHNKPERRGDVSLAQQARRELAQNPQGSLFSEEVAYANYLRYCRMIGPLASPMDFETWQKTDRHLFPQSSRYQTN